MTLLIVLTSLLFIAILAVLALVGYYLVASGLHKNDLAIINNLRHQIEILDRLIALHTMKTVHTITTCSSACPHAPHDPLELPIVEPNPERPEHIRKVAEAHWNGKGHYANKVEIV